VNDTHGHLAGDDVLREVARRMGEPCVHDAVGRHGGDEFLVILPGCDLPAAATLGERLRRAVASGPVATPVGSVLVTVSLGVVAGGGGAAETSSLLREADAALYRAKDAGRNRSQVAAAVDEAAVR
jgi:diguanylate cyclase (GGDEF)-like protein